MSDIAITSNVISGSSISGNVVAGSTVVTSITSVATGASSIGGLTATQSILSAAANPDALIFGTITRNSDGAVTSGSVTWPDGTTGTYTGLVFSTDFLGATDSYSITHGSSTYTQPTMTRDESGAVTTRPALVVS